MTEPLGGRVTYPQMVGYVSRREDSTRRLIREMKVELLTELGEVRKDLEQHSTVLGDRMNAHDTWHRDQLTDQLARAPITRTNTIMAIISLLSLIVAAVSVTVTIVHG